jgi:hypothetical protein
LADIEKMRAKYRSATIHGVRATLMRRLFPYLKQIAVSDRMTLEGLTQFLFQSPRACQQTIATRGHVESDVREGGFCAILIEAARKSLILKRRDVRVVEGARLEIDSRHAC